jgi:hypothetical protein
LAKTGRVDDQFYFGLGATDSPRDSLFFAGIIFAFTVPVLYRKKKQQIDAAICPLVEKTRAMTVGKYVKKDCNPIP